MTVSCAPYVARCFHPEKRFSWRLVGVLLVAPVLLLSLNSVVKCEYPVVEHGRMVSGIKNKYSYQDTVLFECFPGFYLNGSNPVFCGGSSTWEPETPKCIRGYPEPSDRLTLEDFEELDAGIITVIVLTLLVGLAVLCTCLYRCFQRGKKGVSVKLMGLNLTLLRGMPGCLSHCLPSAQVMISDSLLSSESASPSPSAC
ncbi:membrane cofactor protein-like isoform X2 [Mustela nigripes]|uniref:membrane cofactor protein-like isoform X2 n=1 Tax=Mustela nigripes TaxID=77151 RepID=UPI002814ACD3|nr:membrane cofactor protein-like isoform X2 [Mustela nigripes]